MAEEVIESDFWSTVVGGPMGYLHRAQEQLRISGINPHDTDAARKTLGDDVYARYCEAGRLVKKDQSPASNSLP